MSAAAARLQALPLRAKVGAGVLLAAAVAVGPVVLSGYQQVFVLLTMLYIGMAYSWNLISGYTGYLSFGHVAFFGIGAYTVGVLSSPVGYGWPWPLAVIAGGLLASALALPLGWLMLRLRGPYFAIGMLAVAESTRLVASIWDGVTRGGLGIFVSTTYNVSSVYYALLAVVIVVMALTYWVDNSRFGLQLLSIREDEDAAEVLGIDTTREKLKAFVLSALFPGVIGGLYAWYIGYIDPGSVFALSFSMNMILMTLLGGAGTFVGPLIGGVLFAAVLESLWARFPNYHLMLSGLAIMAIVLFIPGGVVSLLRRLGLAARRRRFVAGLAERWQHRPAREEEPGVSPV
jgi:branched-chain amino acid transport system permease protein